MKKLSLFILLIAASFTLMAQVDEYQEYLNSLTKEQEEYLQKVLEEEAVMNTQIGDFGYDANPLTGESDFYKDAMDHKNIMKKGWNGKK